TARHGQRDGNGQQPERTTELTNAHPLQDHRAPDANTYASVVTIPDRVSWSEQSPSSKPAALEPDGGPKLLWRQQAVAGGQQSSHVLPVDFALQEATDDVRSPWRTEVGVLRERLRVHSGAQGLEGEHAGWTAGPGCACVGRRPSIGDHKDM